MQDIETECVPVDVFASPEHLQLTPLYLEPSIC